MSRLLWLSNAPWAPSGYGEQTALFVPRLAEQGHDVACLANYGLAGQYTRWGPVTVYPSDNHWGNVNLGVYADLHRADHVIALCDAWVLHPDTWPEQLTAAIWTPIDHWPIPPAVLAVLQHERITPIAMSRFGHEWMQRFELDPIYVPHGVDTSLFQPRRADRDAIRDELEIPHDVFLVGMVGANVGNPDLPRKMFTKAIDAFTLFAGEHDDAWLYVHANAIAQPGSGMALDEVCELYRAPQGRVRFPHAKAFQLGIPRQAMAYLYGAFDVLLQPSMGEGFGIPLLEAQATGIPVIASDHSAMAELCGAGWLVAGDRWCDYAQRAFFFDPYVPSIVAALEQAYQHRDDEELAARAVGFAIDYDADTVADTYWRHALERLDRTPAAAPTESRQARRARERRERSAA